MKSTSRSLRRSLLAGVCLLRPATAAAAVEPVGGGS